MEDGSISRQMSCQERKHVPDQPFLDGHNLICPERR